MDVLQVFKADAQARGRLAEIARATGVNYKTLHNIAKGRRKDPRSSVVDKLREFYERT